MKFRLKSILKKNGFSIVTGEDGINYASKENIRIPLTAIESLPIGALNQFLKDVQNRAGTITGDSTKQPVPLPIEVIEKIVRESAIKARDMADNSLLRVIQEKDDSLYEMIQIEPNKELEATVEVAINQTFSSDKTVLFSLTKTNNDIVITPWFFIEDTEDSTVAYIIELFRDLILAENMNINHIYILYQSKENDAVAVAVLYDKASRYEWQCKDSIKNLILNRLEDMCQGDILKIQLDHNTGKLSCTISATSRMPLPDFYAHLGMFIMKEPSSFIVAKTNEDSYILTPWFTQFRTMRDSDRPFLKDIASSIDGESKQSNHFTVLSVDCSNKTIELTQLE